MPGSVTDAPGRLTARFVFNLGGYQPQEITLPIDVEECKPVYLPVLRR